MMLPMSLDPAAMAAFALNVLFQVTAICLIALLTTRLVARHDPSLRYYACLACLISLLFSPFIVSRQQATGRYGLITVSLPRYLSRSPAPTSEVLSTSKTNGEAEIGDRTLSAPQPWLGSTVWVLFSVWAAGAVWGILRLVRGCHEVSRLTRDIRPWNPSTHEAMLNRVEQILRRPIPPIFTSPHLKSPVMIGIFRPMVILPEGLPEALASAQLQQILLHECAHIAFHHTCGGMVARQARLLYWPHPLVHALCRELARAREEVCDNVASQEDGAACYARTLLALAQGMDTAPNITSTLALLGQGTSLEDRIAGLLHPRRNRMVRVDRWKLWSVACGATLMLASTAIVRVVSAQENAGSAPARASDAAMAAAITQSQAQALEQQERAQEALRDAAEAAAKQANAVAKQAAIKATSEAVYQQMLAIKQQAAAKQAAIKATSEAVYQQMLAAKQQAEAAKRQAEAAYRTAVAVRQQAQAIERKAAAGVASQKAATASAKLQAEAAYRQAEAAYRQIEAAKLQVQAIAPQAAAEAALQKAKAELDAKQARILAGHRQVVHNPAESAAEMLAAKKQAEAEASKR